MSSDPPSGVVEIYSSRAAQSSLAGLMILWYNRFVCLEFMVSHKSTLMMCAMTPLQACIVGLADYAEALKARLYVLARVSVNWLLTKIEKD